MPTPAHEMADELEPQVRAAFLAMVDALRKVDDAALEALIDRRDFQGILRLWENFLRGRIYVTAQSFGEIYRSLISGVGTATFASVVGTFDVNSPRAISWIQNRAASLVVGVAEDGVQNLRTILHQGYLEGIGGRGIARQLKDSVGLLPSHAVAVTNYTSSLLDQGFNPDYVSRLSSTYANRLLKYRTENIARTEVITAASAGQQEAWEQMIETGILQNHRTWKEWMVTEDDRLCPLCAPMDGQRVRVGEQFRSTHKGFPDGVPEGFSPGSERRRKGPIKPRPGSRPRDLLGRFTSLRKRAEPELEPVKRQRSVLHPPLHPSCRCAVVLRFESATTSGQSASR